ncbi:MAG TPA: cation:proton antiporter [Bryobacteraceae bacterium]
MLSPEIFLSTLALIGAVIVVSALLSGFVERSGLPQVFVFLALGAVIGPAGLRLVDIDVDSPILRVVATLSLVLVLFTDAVSLNIRELGERKLLAALVIGPGTLFSAVLIALVGWKLLDLSFPLAAILGAALASTDPVLLRGFLKRPSLSTGVRQALRLESGMNDAVLLPIVLIAIAATSGQHLNSGDWSGLAIKVLLLSPAAGALVGLAAVASLEFVRRRFGVRRDYESIYSLGVAFAAYAAAEAVHGSGFLAVFAAGLTISALDVELCDCFLEYGETTAEMALLFAFVLFGTSLIWSGLTIAGPLTLIFTLLVLLLRPVAFIPALIPARISWKDRGLIAWFGPRGLSSLLLVLLAVFANVPGSRNLFTICCLVVLCSIVLHGLFPLVFLRGAKPDKGEARPAVGGEKTVPSSSASPATDAQLSDAEYLELSELDEVERAGIPVVIADARTERTYNDSEWEIPDAARLHPDRAAADADRLKLPLDAVVGVLCA